LIFVPACPIRRTAKKLLLAAARLEMIPNFGETIVLHIINSSQPVTGYRIRKQFMLTTKSRFSFGTLIPMLQRLEKSQFVIRVPKGPAEPISYWFLTPDGIEELESRLASMALMLKIFRGRQHGKLNALTMTEVPTEELPVFNF
jgi:DNA-binding PadR family transcriptional regulator